MQYRLSDPAQTDDGTEGDAALKMKFVGNIGNGTPGEALKIQDMEVIEE